MLLRNYKCILNNVSILMQIIVYQHFKSIKQCFIKNKQCKIQELAPFTAFTANSNIKKCKSIHEIDWQLCHKYVLSHEETTFIEKMIKPMV